MTSRMYVALADPFDQAEKDEGIRVALWHGAGNPSPLAIISRTF